MLASIKAIYKDVRLIPKRTVKDETVKTPRSVRKQMELDKHNAYIETIVAYVNKKGPILQSEVLNNLEDQVPRYTCGVIVRHLVRDGLLQSVRAKANSRILTGIEV